MGRRGFRVGRRLGWGALTGTLLVVGACGGEAPPGAKSGARGPDGAGEVPAEWPGGQAWTVGDTPSLRIGEVSGEAAYELEDVTAAAVRADGTLVVADAGTVRIYDSTGSARGVLGRPGEGPGEFVHPTQILTGPAGRITVWDDALRRATTFRSDGTVEEIRTVRLERLLPLMEPGFAPVSGRLLSTGGMVFQLVQKTSGALDKTGGPAPVGADGARNSGILRVAPGLSSGEVVLPLRGAVEVEVSAPWGTMTLVPPLAPRPVLVSQPGGARFCAGDQREAMVSCVDPDGRRYEVRWTAPQRPFRPNSAAVRRWRDTTAAELGVKLAADEVRRLLDQVDVPEFRPPYQALVLDVTGQLWVELGAEDGGGVLWLVFDREGTVLGPVILPRVRVLEIGPEYLLGVRRDDLGIQYLARYPVRRPGNGGLATGGDPRARGTP